jgi:integrase
MPTLIKDPDTGIYHVKFRGQSGMITRSTHEKDRLIAERVVKAAKIAELEMAAKAGALTADAVQSILAGRKVVCADALEGWKQWRHYDSAPNTVHVQAGTIMQFLHLHDAAGWPVTKITTEQINDFINTTDEIKLATREVRLASLRSFFKFCAAKGYCLTNPAMLARVKKRDLTFRLKEPKARRPITEREYHHIVAHTEGFWKWATALSYWTGARLNDICCLEWDAIGAEEIILHTRKDEDRIALPLNDPLIGGGDLILILMEILLTRDGRSPYCFPEERAQILDPQTRSKFSVYYGRILDRFGIEGKSFHCLRHAFATRLEKAGKTIEQVGRLMGHSDTTTTKGYVHH